jgi:superfamily II DNA or RNA helicase
MITLTISNRINVPYINETFDDFLYDSLTIINPLWLENKRMNRFNWKTKKELFFYKEVGENGLLVPRGFLPDIIEYLTDNHLEFKINNKTQKGKEIDFEFSGHLRPFQQIAIEKMLSQNEGTLCAPTGSGKTVMGIYLISRRRQPTIIIVHTKELLYQWIDRLKQFLNIKEKHIGKIGDGNLNEYKPVTIALIQTLRNYPEAINQYGHLIVDECHRVPSKTFTDAVKEFKGRYITGLSATPFRRDGLSKIIGWYVGKILYKIEPRDLIREGHITGIQSIIRKTNFDSKLESPSDEYSALLQEISFDQQRNSLIVNDVIDAVGSGETCLVLSDRKAHCQELKDLLSLSSRTNIPAVVLTGDTDIKERKKIVEDVNAGKIKILIATGQLIGEGFDCKNLSCLFLTMPIRYSGRVIQYIGRVLRPKVGKNKAIIYDYFDHSVRCLHNGMRARKKEYLKLEV